jgi:hypothetical protein
MAKGTPEQMTQEVLRQAGLSFNSMLPHVLKAAGPDYTGKLELSISVDMHCGGISRVFPGAAIKQK